ncbi:hypothetical protein N9C33_03225 [Crocinitomicaceae bacterium]|nr:hypothetical protein [Crocinitomicaceae bacterium]
MPAIVTNKFRIHNAEQFTESFSEASPNVYYLGIGRPQAFGTLTRGDSRTTNEGTDTSPLTPVDSVQDEFYYFDDLLAAKRVTSSDITNVVPRRNWTSGTVYDYYRHDYGNRITGTTTTQTSDSGASTLWDSTFYVLSSANHVYKCLDNNSGANSTVEPTGTSTSILSTGDGYKWKYMYSLSAAQQTNFLSTDFMAVATDGTVSSAATDGAINVVKIKTAGTGGTNGTHTGIAIRGDGSSGTVSVTVSGGAVTAVTVTNAGTGYTFGYIRNADIVSAGATGLSGAELDCIIEPKGGHGFNAVKELGGFYIMLNTNFEASEASNSGDFTTANDFRRVALIRDPNSGGSAATATTLRNTKAVLVTSPSGNFTVDEEINQATTGAVGKVVEWDSSNNILYYIQTRFNDAGVDSNGNQTAFSGTNTITGQSSSVTATPSSSSTTVDNISFTSGYNSGEIDADTGDVMYIENRSPITRASDQTENVKLIIEF